MTTPAERKALLFIAFVAVLGTGARFAQARRDERARPALAGVQALERQLAVVDSVRAGSGTPGVGGVRRVRGVGGRPRDAGASRGRPPTPLTPLAPLAPLTPLTPLTPAPPPPLPVDVDLATAAELERLPGIGPALARRIVASRDSLGPFGSLAGLDRVSGIGPALLGRLAPHVTFSLAPRHHDVRSPDGPGSPARSSKRTHVRAAGGAAATGSVRP